VSRRGIDWVEVVEQAALRTIREALLESTAAHWRKRATDFRRVGTTRCDEIARACEHRAALALVGGDWPEVAATLDDVLAETRDAS
jgi:hypothetical protein